MSSPRAIISALVALGGLSTVLQGCGGGSTTVTTTTTFLGAIPDMAARNKDLSELVVALGAAGLADTLKGTGPFTVFAPTNEAFSALPSQALNFLLQNKTALAQVLTYHVVSGSVLSTDLTNGEKIKTLEGGNAIVSISGTTIKINDAMITTPNVKATNGVIHIIDKVLTPPDYHSATIVDIAANLTAANLSIFVAAVAAAKDVAATLSGPGPFTVCAPTNAAFAALPWLTALLKPENLKNLTALLTYHVAPKVYLTSDLTSGMKIDTLLNGQHVTINTQIGISPPSFEVDVNQAKVIIPSVYPKPEPPIFASSGVIYVIDDVLTYPGFVPPTEQVEMVLV